MSDNVHLIHNLSRYDLNVEIVENFLKSLQALNIISGSMFVAMMLNIAHVDKDAVWL